MIPRYQPSIDLLAWGRWAIADPSKVHNPQLKLLSILKENDYAETAFAFVSGRQALYAYFEHLKQTVGKGTVLISAQICPIVPYIVRDLGFTVRFVDLDFAYPTPSANQYIQAIDTDTVGIIVAPLYGYIQQEWQPLLSNLQGIKLILDLAQGLGLKESIKPLFQRADAVVYSFGIGKGLDTGGALLLTSSSLNTIDYSQKGKLHYLGILSKGIALRVLIKTGLYPYFIKRLDTAVEMMKQPSLIERSSGCLAPANIYQLWDARVQSLLMDLKLARIRARELGELPLVQKACRDIPVFCSQEAIHLRQIIRFKDVGLRALVLETLRQLAVDCLSAGEPLPHEYFDTKGQADFPNARAFREDSIRLPFLGRLDAAQFNQLKGKLENAIAQHLSH